MKDCRFNPFKQAKSRRSHTLAEILIFTVILAGLLTVSVAYIRGRPDQQKKCAENLRRIYEGIESYRDANGSYPPDGNPVNAPTQCLKYALYPAYISDENVFKCPAGGGAADNYSLFYARPGDYTQLDTYMLGCPRHEGSARGLNLFLGGQIFKQKLADVMIGDPPSVLASPGSSYSGDPCKMTFADGTTATVAAGGSVTLISSFYLGEKCYSIIKKESAGTNVTTTVEEGSRIDVIAPAVY